MSTSEISGYSGSVGAVAAGTSKISGYSGAVGQVGGTSKISGYSGSVGELAGEGQFGIVQADGTVNWGSIVTDSLGGVTRTMRWEVLGTPSLPVDPNPPSGSFISFDPAYGAWEDNSGLAARGLDWDDLEPLTPAQWNAKAIRGAYLEGYRCQATATERPKDVGGVHFKNCATRGFLPTVSRGPYYTAYTQYGTKASGATSPRQLEGPASYTDPPSLWEESDLGGHGQDGERVYPWVANALHSEGLAYAIYYPTSTVNRVWRCNTDNRDATFVVSKYDDLGPNPTKSVAYSNSLSGKLAAGDSSSTGGQTWVISGDPYLYSPYVWDALPGNFWLKGMTDGPRTLDRCRVLGGGDLLNFRYRFNATQTYFANPNKGFSGGYGNVSGMYPDKPETLYYHSDGMQSVGNSVTSGDMLCKIAQSTILGITKDGTLCNSAAIFQNNSGPINGLQMIGNILDGGGYTAYPANVSYRSGTDILSTYPITNVRWEDNRWGQWAPGTTRLNYQTAGATFSAGWGPFTYGGNSSGVAYTSPPPGWTWKNNTWLADGTFYLQLLKRYIRCVRGADITTWKASLV